MIKAVAHKGASHKGPTQRQLRVGELIRHALADLFVRSEIADDALTGVVLTVTEVKVSTDLKYATVFVLPAGEEADQDKAVAALVRHKKFVRGELARRVELRYIPDIAFKLDRTFDEAARVDAILRSPAVARDLG